jgi:transcriptional regulator with XRE-family HTH domain
MQQDLWRLRFQKRWTINDLSDRSGVPGLSIFEYDQGQTIRSADLPKLAEALGVEPDEIKLQSSPKPRKPRGRAKRTRSDRPKKSPPPKPASETQISHLVALAVKLGETRADVEKKIGNPLEKLNRKEISKWLTQYTDRIKERKQKIADDPAGTKRWRAHLPEGVDSFELHYLQDQKRAKAEITFTLFNDKEFTGRILGFGPYNITVRTKDGEDVTLQKLAIAYYSVASTGDES